jgi:MoxR-like ATPase
MTNHAKYDEVKKLIDASIPVLLTGEAGSGKTTLAKQIADDMKLPFRSMSMTRQTTLSHILGFLSVNGTYVKSVFRTCFQDGGMMLLDEIDGGDPNVLLAFNTIENGYVTFPDELVKCHPDFRLVATANPQDQHNFYTGRSKLDAATLDRFDIIDVERDDKLECSLVDNDTHNRMQLMRKIMGEHNASKTVSMRDALRYQKRKELNLVSENFVACLADKSSLVLEQYYKQVEDIPKHQDQSECKSYDELVDLLKVRAGGSDFPKDSTNITSDNPYGEPKDEPDS